MNKIKYCWNCGNEVLYRTYKDINFIPTCPKCGSLYPEKPKDEALLSMYQDEYLKNRTDENFNNLFKLLSKVTFNVICHKLRIKSSYEKIDDIMDKVQWSLEKLAKYYKEKPNFKITTSFIQYIGQLVLYPLYNSSDKEKEEKEISLSTPLFGKEGDKGTKELLDYLSKEDDGNINFIEDEISYSQSEKALSSKSLEFIKDSVNSMYDYYKNEKSSFKNAYYLLILYYLFFTNSDMYREISNSFDLKLVKKFEILKEKYKDLLFDFANEGN